MATMEYKCPKCGAPISFNPDKQLFSCEYCGADTTVEEIQKLYAQQEQTETINEREVKHSEQEQQKAQAKGEEFDEDAIVSYVCPSCGAEVITAASTAATECYYCQNPVVLGSRLSGEYRPDFVIPFTLNKDKAVLIQDGYTLPALEDWPLEMIIQFCEDNEIPCQGAVTKVDYIRAITQGGRSDPPHFPAEEAVNIGYPKPDEDIQDDLK